MSGAAPQRTFHGLNGGELRVVLATELKSMLYERLEKYLEAPLKINATYRMVLDSYPAGDRQPSVNVAFTVRGTGAQCLEQILATIKHHYDHDTDFGAHLTFPKVTWRQELDLDAFRTGEAPAVAPPPPAPIDAVDLRVARASAAGDPRDDRIAQLERMVNDLVAGRKTEGAAGSERIERFDGRTPPTTRSLGLNVAKTGTDLDITGSAERSPGAAMAESFGGGSPAAPLAVPLERMHLGVEHPALAEGGAGSADAIRRGAGLVVPMPQRDARSGHVSDFPIGQL